MFADFCDVYICVFSLTATFLESGQPKEPEFIGKPDVVTGAAGSNACTQTDVAELMVFSLHAAFRRL